MKTSLTRIIEQIKCNSSANTNHKEQIINTWEKHNCHDWSKRLFHLSFYCYYNGPLFYRVVPKHPDNTPHLMTDDNRGGNSATTSVFQMLRDS